MIKTIDFAGIELDNYTVREMIMNVEKDMSDHGFHTIEEVNMDTLMLAETDELVRKAIGFAEHTVIAENGILEAVGAGSYQHRHEIEHQDFFFDLMERWKRPVLFCQSILENARSWEQKRLKTVRGGRMPWSMRSMH